MVGIWWENLSSIIWSPDLWLPENITWNDVQPNRDFNYPTSTDIFIVPIIISLIIIVTKQFLVDRFILIPLANIAGVSNIRTKSPPQNNNLEDVYKTYGTKPPHKELLKRTEVLKMSVQQMARWLHQRHASSAGNKYDKFCETGFELITHVFMFVFSVVVLYNKSWFWDIDQCWEGYPRHNITPDLWWYYMIGLAYYYAATFFQLLIVKDKKSDANQMLLHHFFTIMLMILSWSINFVRVGILIYAIHEFADIPLLSAKMCKYTGIGTLTDFLFTCFIFIWLFTRCYLFPFWILKSVFFNAPILSGIPVVIFCKCLLIGLLIMNLIWTFLIAGIIVKKFTGGPLEDIRSDIEDSSDNDEILDKRKND